MHVSYTATCFWKPDPVLFICHAEIGCILWNMYLANTTFI